MMNEASFKMAICNNVEARIAGALKHAGNPLHTHAGVCYDAVCQIKIVIMAGCPTGLSHHDYLGLSKIAAIPALARTREGK